MKKIKVETVKVFATLFTKSVQVWAEPTGEKRSTKRNNEKQSEAIIKKTG